MSDDINHASKLAELSTPLSPINVICYKIIVCYASDVTFTMTRWLRHKL